MPVDLSLLVLQILDPARHEPQSLPENPHFPALGPIQGIHQGQVEGHLRRMHHHLSLVLLHVASHTSSCFKGAITVPHLLQLAFDMHNIAEQKDY